MAEIEKNFIHDIIDEDLLAEAERQGLRVFLLGGREGVSLRAAERLLQKHPRLQICGMQHGYFERTGKENAAILERIRQARTDVLIVCLGFPLQEEWIMLNNLNVKNCFYMDTTALNKYTVQGILPQAKPAMLEGIRQLLEQERP